MQTLCIYYCNSLFSLNDEHEDVSRYPSIPGWVKERKSHDSFHMSSLTLKVFPNLWDNSTT